MQTVAQGTVRKMQSRLEVPVSYSLRLGDSVAPLNRLLNHKISLRFNGEINCVHCGRASKKSFNQGYCYPCFQRLAQCDSCIIHPEKCHFDLGTCREPEWGEKFCLQDHIVYLANSSSVKVGITRSTQIPERWIDQGATQALAIIRVRSRLQSGTLEVVFKQYMSDKTNWRQMLMSNYDEIDLLHEKDKLLNQSAEQIRELEDRFGFFAISILHGVEPINIEYPILEIPEKVTSLSFDNQSLIEGVLLGIKGQYLILDCGVINIRRFSGYTIELLEGV